MNYRMICNIIAKIVCVEAGFMLPALLISAFSGETAAALAFAVSIVLMLALALPLALKKTTKKEKATANVK